MKKFDICLWLLFNFFSSIMHLYDTVISLFGFIEIIILIVWIDFKLKSINYAGRQYQCHTKK